MYSLLIFGKGGHSRVVRDALYYPRTPDTIKVGEFFGPYLSFVSDPITDGELLTCHNPKEYGAFVAVGDNSTRAIIHGRLASLNYTLSNVIHPTAVIGNNVKLGHGIYIGPYAVINSDSVLDDGVIVNTAATVDHDCHIGQFTHIAPGVSLCGHVQVGHLCLIGAGSVVIPRVKIDNNVIIGAGGAVVDSFVPPHSRLLGVPARSTQITESG